MNLRRRNWMAASLVLLGTLLTVSRGAHGADPEKPFPAKLVTLVVPFTAGSGSDTISRVIAPKLSARWGQPVVVDNRPGASGNIGTQHVARSAPDGHTLLMAINTFTITPALYKNLPYDPIRDFVPIGKLAEVNSALVVHPSLPVNDLRSFVTYVKQHPGELNYGTPGNGTPHHMSMELLKNAGGLAIVHVPYKGIAGAITDLVGGQVQAMIAGIPSIRTQAQAGKLKVLAVTGDNRSEQFPAVPTFKEQGYPGVGEASGWYAVLAPAGTPKDLVTSLNRDFAEAMNSPDVVAELERQGLRVRTGPPDELQRLVGNMLARWKALASAAGIEQD